MSHCWKCSKPLPDGKIECDLHSSVNVTHTDARFKLIDWNKVNSLDDMKKVMHFMGLRVLIGSEVWEQLKEFLED